LEDPQRSPNLRPLDKLKPGVSPPSQVFDEMTRILAEEGVHEAFTVQRLRRDGIDARFDQFEESPPQGWPLWYARQILDFELWPAGAHEELSRRFPQS
jgi:hypothetical protein